jgi:putative membrane protein
MVKFILRCLVVAVGFWVAAQLLRGHGVYIQGWKTLLAASVLLGIVNGLVRPIVTLLTLPITILTLGLFLLVVNGLMVLLVGWLLHQFHDYHYRIDGLMPAIFTTVIIWLVSLVGNMVIGGDERQRRR